MMQRKFHCITDGGSKCCKCGRLLIDAMRAADPESVDSDKPLFVEHEETWEAFNEFVKCRPLDLKAKAIELIASNCG